MPAFVVVELFDVEVYLPCSFLPGVVVSSFHFFALQCTEGAFYDDIVVTVAFAVHRGNDLEARQ